MSHVRRLAGRAAFSVVGAYFVVSVAFLLAAITPRGKTFSEGPLLDRYLDFLVSVTTLDWGYSTTGRGPVFDALAEAIPHTLAYLVPAVFLSVVVGVSTGAYAALNPNGRVDRAASILTYFGNAVPNFFVGSLIVLLFAVDPLKGMPAYDDSLVQRVVWPAALLSTTLLASQFRYARAQTREYTSTDVVKLLDAKGGGPTTVVRHVLRNAALPLVSLFFLEAFAVLVVAVAVVESLFAIPGIGYMLLNGVWNHDVPTVLGTTVVFVVVGFGGNFLQDTAYVLLDPRVDAA